MAKTEIFHMGTGSQEDSRHLGPCEANAKENTIELGMEIVVTH